jgi:hypothetical protein
MVIVSKEIAWLKKHKRIITNSKKNVYAYCEWQNRKSLVRDFEPLN